MKMTDRRIYAIEMMAGLLIFLAFIGYASGAVTNITDNRVISDAFIMGSTHLGGHYLGLGNQTGNTTLEILTAMNASNFNTTGFIDAAIGIFMKGTHIGGLFIGVGNQTGNTSTEIWTVVDNSTFTRYGLYVAIGNQTGNTSKEIWAVVDNSTFARYGLYIALGNATGNTSTEIWSVIDNSTFPRYGLYVAIGNQTGNTSKEIWSVIDNSTFPRYGLYIAIGNQTGNTTEEVLETNRAYSFWNDSYLIHYGNLTLCAEDKILQVSGGAWTCQDAASGGGGGDKWVDNGTYLTPNVTYANGINLSEVGGWLDAVAGLFMGGVHLSGLFQFSNYTYAGEVAGTADALMVDENLTLDGGRWNLSYNIYSGTLGMTNITACATAGQFHKVSGGAWVCSADSANSSEEMIAATNSTMEEYVNNTNATMKGYVDSQNIEFNTTMVEYVNNTNATLKTYCDAQDIVYNTTMEEYVNNTNSTLKAYCEAQDIVYNITMEEYVNNTNSSMKNYVDSRTYPGDVFLNTSGEDFNQSQHIVPGLNLTYNWGNATHFISNIFANIIRAVTGYFGTLFEGGVSLASKYALNATMEEYVNNTNATMKGYVDSQNIEFNTTMVEYVNNTNATMKGYVDTQNIEFNTTMVEYVNNTNATMKNYVDSMNNSAQWNATLGTFDNAQVAMNLTAADTIIGNITDGGNNFDMYWNGTCQILKTRSSGTYIAIC